MLPQKMETEYSFQSFIRVRGSRSAGFSRLIFHKSCCFAHFPLPFLTVPPLLLMKQPADGSIFCFVPASNAYMIASSSDKPACFCSLMLYHPLVIFRNHFHEFRPTLFPILQYRSCFCAFCIFVMVFESSFSVRDLPHVFKCFKLDHFWIAFPFKASLSSAYT